MEELRACRPAALRQCIYVTFYAGAVKKGAHVLLAHVKVRPRGSGDFALFGGKCFRFLRSRVTVFESHRNSYVWLQSLEDKCEALSSAAEQKNAMEQR